MYAALLKPAQRQGEDPVGGYGLGDDPSGSNMDDDGFRYHYHPPMMAPNSYYPDGKDQDAVYDESTRQLNPYYATMDLAMPDMSAAFSQFQPGAWQCEPSNMMWMEVLQSWPTNGTNSTNGTNGTVNTTQPVTSDWQPSPIEAWDMQAINPVVPVANLQNMQMPDIQSPAPVRADTAFRRPSPRFGETFSADNYWATGWDEEAFTAVGEVAPFVEAAQVPGYSTAIDVPIPVEVPVQVPVQVPERRRRAPTPTIEFPEYATLVSEGPMPPVPVQVERRRRAPTPTIVTPEYNTPIAQSTPIPLTTSQPPSQLAKAVRPAPARRETTARLRRGAPTVFKTQSENSKRGHYAPNVWEGHKAIIKKLYIDEGKSLKELMRTMEHEHDFPATQRMYKARFKQWGFVKNNTERVVSQMLRTKFERDAAGKISEFTRNGKSVNLQNYLQRKGKTEYDLVDFQASGSSAFALAHVRCRTPPLDVPSDLRLPDRLRFQDTLVMSFRRAFLLWRQEDQENAFGSSPSVFTWRVTDFPHLSSLIESARLMRGGGGGVGGATAATAAVAALNQAFRAMNASYLGSMDVTSSFYFFFHRQSRPWQEDSRIALAVWKFLAAYAASARGHNNHPLFHTFRLMYEVVQKGGVAGLRELLTDSSNTVADELESAFGKEHWLKDLIWNRCFPEKSKSRHLQLIRDMRDHGPTKKIVRRLY